MRATENSRVRARPARFAEAPAARAPTTTAGRERRRVVRRDEEPGLAVDDELGQRADVASRRPAGRRASPRAPRGRSPPSAPGGRRRRRGEARRRRRGTRPSRNTRRSTPSSRASRSSDSRSGPSPSTTSTTSSGSDRRARGSRRRFPSAPSGATPRAAIRAPSGTASGALTPHGSGRLVEPVVDRLDLRCRDADLARS